MQPKIITFFLPQFHEIPENNEWHGKGFTEWTNVKKARPLFKGHAQPKIPYEYYNLLNKTTRRNIGEMAKKYGIYGFCYYHYRFEGRLLLEKPLELYLKDGEPNINFCFSWANHSRKRTRGKGLNKKTEILLDQKYGGIEDRERHFNYLLPFFKNKNYIRINNKPVFIIFDIKNFKEFDLMAEYWENKAKKEGFNGIYFVETLNSANDEKISEKTQCLIQFEPLLSLKGTNLSLKNKLVIGLKLLYNKYLSKFLNHEFLYKFNFDEIRSSSLKREYKDRNIKIRYGGFPRRDNSPRKGKNAYIITGGTPEKFGQYMSQLKNKSIKKGSEFIFINARNERAEGDYLEPDEINGYKYLEQIQKL